MGGGKENSLASLPGETVKAIAESYVVSADRAQNGFRQAGPGRPAVGGLPLVEAVLMEETN